MFLSPKPSFRQLSVGLILFSSLLAFLLFNQYVPTARAADPLTLPAAFIDRVPLEEVTPTLTPTPLVNLLTNGGLETGSLSGWDDYGGITVESAAAYSGSFGAQMATNGRIDQRFNTTVGQTYYVAARIRINQQLVNPTWGGLRVQIVNANWSQLAVSPSLTIANSPAGQWTRVYFSFVANTTQSRLIYQNFSGGGQFNASADEFIVSPNPIPDVSQATATPVPTATPTPLPLPTNTPTSTPTSLPAQTATPITTPTLTFTPTATIPTATPMPTFTPTPGPVYFPVGAGFTDVIPHQIVRTAGGQIYLFAPEKPYSTILKAYWTQSSGLPSQSTDFAGTAQVADTANLISADALYDGTAFVHVLVNTQAGVLKDYVFDLSTGTFRPAFILATGNPTVAGDYIGTSGVSGLIDSLGQLHMAYWSGNQHISYERYTYAAATHALTLVEGPTQVDTNDNANHPALALSPVDGQVTVAWISQATTPARILTRARRATDTWGAVETASTAPVWTSTNAGINIDQGPALLIDAAGHRHLTYIQNYDATGDYGRIHYVSDMGGGWIDQTLPVYTHDPALALDSNGDLFIIGHGHPNNSACLLMTQLCVVKKNMDGSWGTPQLLAVPQGTDSFDVSVSVKWSVVGFNQPELIEFTFFAAEDGNYSQSTLYYGRLVVESVAPTVTPTFTPTPLPTATHTPDATSTPTLTPTSLPPTDTAEPTFTSTPLPPTATNTPFPPTPTDTPEATFTPTPFPPTPTDTAEATFTPTLPVPTATDTPLSPTATDTAEPTSTPTSLLTPTDTPLPTFTPTLTPTALPPTATDTPEPTLTPTPLPPTATNTPLPPTVTPTATVTPGSAGFPSTGILDNFNRANGGIGGNWGGLVGGYAISANLLAVNGGNDIYWSVSSFGADQEVYVTLSSVDAAATEIDLLLKAQTATQWGNGLIEVWYQPASQFVQVWTFAPGQGWVQHGANIPVTFMNGDQFGARATSDGLVSVYRNGMLLATRSITSWAFAGGPGYIGLWMANASNTLLDDFGGGNAITGPTPTPTNTPIPTPTYTPLPPTSTPTPGPTPTPTFTPTPLPPTATATPTPTSTSNLMYLSSTTGGTVSGITFADEDILLYNPTTGAWSLFFDGSDVGLGGVDVSSWDLQADGSFLFSVDAPVTLATVGAIDDSDIIRFTPTSTGSTTTGTFSWYFDGSDVGLDLDAEEIDALDVLANGQIIVSTTGSFSVTGASGLDEDLIAFTPTSLGNTTAGTWSFYFDGSDVGLSNNSNEEITNVWVASNGDLYLSALGAFTVTGASGDGADVFRCVPGSLGNTTTCTFNLVWDGSLNGFAGEVLDVLVIVEP